MLEAARPYLEPLAPYAFAVLLVALAALLYFAARARQRLDEAAGGPENVPADLDRQLALRFSAVATGKLEALRVRARVETPGETVRRALALYDALLAAEEEGGRTYVLRRSGDPERVRLP